MNALTILAVDDDPQMLTLIERVTASHGHALIKARSGEEAGAAIQGKAVDAVILDFMLEGENARDVYDRLRSRLPKVPFIVLSAVPYASVGPALEGLQFLAYLEKINLVEDLPMLLASIASRKTT